jgi:hypothetical protein
MYSIRSAIAIIAIGIYVNCENKLEIVLKTLHSANSKFCSPVIQVYNLRILISVINYFYKEITSGS